MLKTFACALALLSSISAACAQQWTSVRLIDQPGLGPSYPNEGSLLDPNVNRVLVSNPFPCDNPSNNNICMTTGAVDIRNFAQAGGTTANFAAIDAQLRRLEGQASRGLEVGAIAAAMKDAIPNPGDRFAIRIGAAAFAGYAAGSIGVAYNVTDNVRANLTYGQGERTSVVSGGLNFSFR